MPNFQDWSVGLAKESVFGTVVAPTRWLEFTNAAPFKPTLGLKQGEGMRPGRRVARSARRVSTLKGAGGPINVELFSKGLGLLLEACLGQGVSTLVPAGSTYQQVFKLADTLPSYSIQFGVPNAAGTIAAHTFPGAVVESWEIGGAVGDIATLQTTWDARELNTAQAYAAPSYPNGGTLYLVQDATILTGAITAPTATALSTGGTEIATVKSFKVSQSNAPVKDRYFANQGGRKALQLPATRAITGELVIEYGDETLRDAWLAQAPMALLIRLVTPTALSVGVETIEILIPEIKIDDDPLPTASNGDSIPARTVGWTGLDNLTAADPIVIAVRTSDTAL